MDLAMPKITAAEAAHFAKQVAGMMRGDTMSLAMGAKARANRAKPTGQAKLMELIGQYDWCRCGERAQISCQATGPWGRMAWVRYCVPCGMPEGWRPVEQNSFASTR